MILMFKTKHFLADEHEISKFFCGSGWKILKRVHLESSLLRYVGLFYLEYTD